MQNTRKLKFLTVHCIFKALGEEYMFSEKLYAFGEASFVLRQNFKLTCNLYAKGITFLVIKVCSVFNSDLSTVFFCTMQTCK